ncbi:MAG: hypothetical protein WBO34_08625 [Gammaproteobacteria bacterium]
MKDARRRNRWIMGAFIGTAAIAVAIDHTRHRLPTPAQPVEQSQSQTTVVAIDEENEAPCGLDDSPCSMDDSPCSLDEMDDTGDDAPCSL